MADFVFDKKTRTYFRDSRPVKPETLRAWVAEVLERTRGEMKAVTQSFVEGSINRPAWFLEMRSLVARSHGSLAMLAQGGKNAMDESAWGRAGQKIKTEAAFLRSFERDIANGKAGTDAQVVARAQLYANALHSSYEAAVLAREKDAGVKRVLRVLGEPLTGHCNDCPTLAGEYGIDEVPGIGDSECGPMCNCFIVSVEVEGVAA
jgi:hypothetical protein